MSKNNLIRISDSGWPVIDPDPDLGDPLDGVEDWAPLSEATRRAHGFDAPGDAPSADLAQAQRDEEAFECVFVEEEPPDD